MLFSCSLCFFLSFQGNNSPDRPNGFMSPTTNNTAYNSGYNSGYNTATNSYHTDGSSQPHGNNNTTNYPTINSYYPTPNSNPYNPALQGSVGSGHSMQAALPHAATGNKYPLNKEFSGVLERGSLQDIARLLESTAPRPEVRAFWFLLISCFLFTRFFSHMFGVCNNMPVTR